MVPFQLVLVSPVLVPVWVAGLVRLLRAGAGRPFRAFALAYGLLLLFVIATGGKAYYTGGLLPALVAAGGLAVDAWLTRGRPALRRPLLVAALVLSLGIDALIGLDLLTPGQLNGPVLALNPDAGEQVGWPQFTATVAAGWRQIPADDRRMRLSSPGTTGRPARSTGTARPLGCPLPTAGTTASPTGDHHRTGPGRSSSSAIRSASRCSPRPSTTAIRSPPSTITSPWTTRSEALRWCCAPPPADPGPSYGHGCATTTSDSTPATTRSGGARGESVALADSETLAIARGVTPQDLDGLDHGDLRGRSTGGELLDQGRDARPGTG